MSRDAAPSEDPLAAALPYLNLARRKRALVLGQEAVKRALKRGKCRLLILAEDAGASLQRLDTGTVPVAVLGDRRRLGDWLDREELAILALTDPDLARGILMRLGSDGGARRRERR